MKQHGKRLLAGAGFIAAALLLLYLAFVTAMPDLLPVLESGDEAQIEAYLLREGRWAGMLCTMLLQFVQVVSIVLPGAPIQIAAGIVYGALRGFALCHLAYVAANLAVFFAARHLGGKLDQWLPAADQTSSRLDLFRNSTDPWFITVLACLVPLMPNGIIPYAAARSGLRLGQFAWAVYLGSFAPILIFCTVGSHILAGDYLLAALLLGGLGLFILALYRQRGRIMAWRSARHTKP